MAEFEYRGYRVRTVFDRDWRIKVWPPLRPSVMEKIHASRSEGEAACHKRAARAIDEVVDHQEARRPD